MKKIKLNSDTLAFVKERVLTVTELTRTNKLTEILDSYANDPDGEEVYIIQNTRNRDAQAVLVEAGYFAELLKYKEAMEWAIDQVMEVTVAERKDEEANIPLKQVVEELNIDLSEAVKISQKIELED